MEDFYWYQKKGDGSVRLLRMFGTSPEVVVPSEIEGMPVTEIGEYCFARDRQVTDYLVSPDGRKEEVSTYRLTPLCGNYIQTIFLPDSVRSLDRFAFYQCSSLRELSVGAYLTDIGSDVFMNCRNLTSIILRAEITAPTGLRQLLAQRPAEIKVTFLPEQGQRAELLYPEFTETYDEIGPAHIFALNISGEGFRARQSFQDGVVNLAQYDGVFARLCPVEEEETLCRMAMYRLYYPVGLHGEHREQYEDYARQHIVCLYRILLKEKNIFFLMHFGEEGFFTREQLSACIAEATALKWAEGAGTLLQGQSRWFGEVEREYSFEEF